MRKAFEGNLEVHTDDRLFPEVVVNRSSLEHEIAKEVEDGSIQEPKILLDILRAGKVAMKKYLWLESNI